MIETNTSSPKYVLLSNVGNTDPVLFKKDGPLLHICRHYHPQLIYLLLTPSMQEPPKLDIVLGAIKHLYAFYHLQAPEIVLFPILTDNPARFSNFGYGRLFDEVSEKHPDYSILVNISSGTPQMIASMCLEIVTNNRKATTIQVDSPFPDKPRVVETIIFDENQDFSPQADNRNNVTDLFSFNLSKTLLQFQNHIQKYEYKLALSLIKQMKINNPNLLALIQLGADPDLLSSRQTADKFGLIMADTGDEQMDKIAEYFLQWQLDFWRGKYINFVLKTNSIIYALTKYALLHTVDTSKNTSFWDRISHQDKISKNQLDSMAPRHDIYFKEQSNIVEATTVDLLAIYKFYLGESQLTNLLENVIDTEFYARRKLAHYIDFSKSKEVHFSNDANQILIDVKAIMQKLFKDKASQINFYYHQELNKFIFKEAKKTENAD